MAKDLKTILQELQVCINDANLARHEAEDPDERKVLGKLFSDLSTLSEEAWGYINPLQESSTVSDDLTSVLDSIIGDFENKKSDYSDTLQRLSNLKRSAHASEDYDLEDEIQDYINRMGSISLGEGNSDLAGPNFKETLRRLGKQRRKIQQESPTQHEYVEAMNQHNDEIDRYLRTLNNSDPRREALINLWLSYNDYGLSD